MIKQLIGDPLYLERWILFPYNKFFNVYIHKFHRSDDDRALHDHPWFNLSFILTGEYLEHFADNTILHRKAGQFILRGARTAHRIELINNKPVLTLFFTFLKIRSWGFYCPQGWRHWKEYTDNTGKTIGKGCE